MDRWWRFVEKIVPPEVNYIIGILKKHGFAVYIVGGAPRDLMLNKVPTDWDLATDALPETVEELLSGSADRNIKTVSMGKRFGMIKALINDLQIEVTTFRREGGYSDGRRPDWVEFTPAVEEDLSRRDFTINAMAIDYLDHVFIDPFGGRKDLRRKIVRTVGEPRQRFKEDALRMLRFFRFQANLGFRGDRLTEKAVKPSLISSISCERIREELTKVLISPQPQLGLWGLIRTELLGFILPEMIPVLNDHRILQHIIKAVEVIKPLPYLRWAAFLHDIGKGECKNIDESRARGGLHFHGHEEVGERISLGLLERLGFSREFKNKVLPLIRWHMFSADPLMTDAALRRLAFRVGEGNLLDLLELRRADIIATGGRYHLAWESFSAFSSRVEAFLKQEKVLTIKDLVVNGDDIMKFLGISQGPQIGRVLNALFCWVTEEPTRNNKKDLYHYLVEHYTK